MDRLESGKTGTVSLRVKVEGETQNNDYQKTLARLKMTFAVEKVSGPVIEHQPGSVHTETKFITNRVKTGDTSRILLYAGLGLGSGLLLLVVGIRSSRRRKSSRKGERAE